MGDRYSELDPALKLRIRRVLIVSSVWAGLLVVSAGVFVAFKPYLDRKREERLKQPGYKPLVFKKKPNSTKSKHRKRFVLSMY